MATVVFLLLGGACALAVLILVVGAPVRWWRYRRLTARTARVGAHVVEVDVEEDSYYGKHGHTTDYTYHAQVAFVSEDGRELVVPMTFDRVVEEGAELWVLHDRDRPEEVSVERERHWLRNQVLESVFPVLGFSFLAVLFLQLAGVIPEILPWD